MNSTLRGLSIQLLDAGFEIEAKIEMDRLGPRNKVIVRREGRKVQRTARQYQEALRKCADQLIFLGEFKAEQEE